MGWADKDSFLTKLFSGDPFAILISLFFTIALPALLHYYLYTTAPQKALQPTFLLLGPSGSGKTSLVTLLQRRIGHVDGIEASPTRTSQIPASISLLLPTSIPLGSNKYRSINDNELKDAAKNATKYTIIDTPGHGKLRLEQAFSHLRNSAVRGVIFMIDSTAFDSSDTDTARDTATYLHDLLLLLQRRKSGKTKAKMDIPVLIAANKQDLFTALPAGAIRERLQTEIEKVRKGRSKAISRVDADPDAEEETEGLGGDGEQPFSFKLLEEEFDMPTTEIVGGCVRGEEAGKGVQRWEEWVGGLL